MAKANLYNKKFEAVGTVELQDSIYGVEVKPHLVHEVVLAQLQWKRQCSANTKGRSDVRGGGKKPYKQKGTGSARRGSSRSPVMVGGGIVFGPKPKVINYKVNKKVMAYALKSVLSDKANNQKIYVFEDLDFPKASAKQVRGLADTLKLNKALIVDVDNGALKLSVRNLHTLKYLQTAGLNVYDLLKFENLVVTKKALESIEKKLVKKA